MSTIERSGGRCHVVDMGKTKAARRTLVMSEFLRIALVDQVAKYSDEEWVVAARKGGFLRYDNSPDAGVQPRGGADGTRALDVSLPASTSGCVRGR